MPARLRARVRGAAMSAAGTRCSSQVFPHRTRPSPPALVSLCAVMAEHGICQCCFAVLDGEEAIEALVCGHVFHVDCVTRWQATRGVGEEHPPCLVCKIKQCGGNAVPCQLCADSSDEGENVQAVVAGRAGLDEGTAIDTRDASCVSRDGPPGNGEGEEELEFLSPKHAESRSCGVPAVVEPRGVSCASSGHIGARGGPAQPEAANSIAQLNPMWALIGWAVPLPFSEQCNKGAQGGPSGGSGHGETARALGSRPRSRSRFCGGPGVDATEGTSRGSGSAGAPSAGAQTRDTQTPQKKKQRKDEARGVGSADQPLAGARGFGAALSSRREDSRTPPRRLAPPSGRQGVRPTARERSTNRKFRVRGKGGRCALLAAAEHVAANEGTSRSSGSAGALSALAQNGEAKAPQKKEEEGARRGCRGRAVGGGARRR